MIKVENNKILANNINLLQANEFYIIRTYATHSQAVQNAKKIAKYYNDRLDKGQADNKKE